MVGAKTFGKEIASYDAPGVGANAPCGVDEGVLRDGQGLSADDARFADAEEGKHQDDVEECRAQDGGGDQKKEEERDGHLGINDAAYGGVGDAVDPGGDQSEGERVGDAEPYGAQCDEHGYARAEDDAAEEVLPQVVGA